MYEKENNKDDFVITAFDFPIDTSVFNTNTGDGAVAPTANVPTDVDNAISEDTVYNLTKSNNSSINSKNFTYSDSVDESYKLVFKGWGNGTTPDGASPMSISNNHFNFVGYPVSLVFGTFLSVTGNDFNLVAGSTFQLTGYYNSSPSISSSDGQKFSNNTVTLGDNSQFSFVLDASYAGKVSTSVLNEYTFSGNTFNLGNNVNLNLSPGASTVYPKGIGGMNVQTSVYANNVFNLGENNTLTLGESGTSSLTKNNKIYAGTGSTINFQSNHGSDYNKVNYVTSGSKKVVTATYQTDGGLFKQTVNTWDSTNQIIFKDGVSDVTVNVDPNFLFNVSTWDTGINGTVNFSGTFNPSTIQIKPVIGSYTTTVNVRDGSSFNIIGETASVNSVNFKLGKGSSLNIGQDVLLPTTYLYTQTTGSTWNKDINIGKVINSDNTTFYNGFAGIFNSGVDFSDGDESSTLTIGNLSLHGGKELTYLMNIKGLDENRGRILLENLNGFQIDTLEFFNQSALGSATTNANAYVKVNFKNDAGEIATLYLKMDVHGTLYFHEIQDSAGNIVGYELSICFNEGTLIETINGNQAVETLKRGDLVKTKNGFRAVSWVGHKRKELSAERKKEDFLVLIKKDAFSENVPSRDLRVTAEHCLYLEGKLIPSRMLVNGRSIVYDYETTSFTIWHVECAEHQVIFAENVPVESYLDTGNRYTFHGCENVLPINNSDKWSSHAVAELCTEMSFVESIWKIINQRAIDMNILASESNREEVLQPNVHLCMDNGKEIYPVDVQDQVYTFVLDQPTEFVSIMSYVITPEDVYGSFVDDRRQLGIAVGFVQMTVADGREILINHHLFSQKEVGWHDLEGPSVHYRWTKGCAYLPLNMNAFADQQVTLRIQVISALPKYFKKSVKYNFLFEKAS